MERDDSIGTSLTPRQVEVLRLIAAGKTNGEIAEKLGLTVDGVKWHVSEILSRLQLANREEAAAAWRRERAPLRRLRQATGWLTIPLAAKVAVGGFLVAVAGTAVAIAATGGGDGDAPLAAASKSSATPADTAAVIAVATPTPVLCPQLEGIRQSWTEGDPLCPALMIPQFAQAAGPDCNFDGQVLPPVNMGWLWKTTFEGCSMRGADLSYLNANDADFKGVDMTGAVLSGGTFGRANFEGAIMRDVVANPGVFDGASFRNADLTGADLSNAILNGVAWTGATCPDGSSADAQTPPTCIGTVGLESPPTTYAMNPGGTGCYIPRAPVPEGTPRCPAMSVPELAALATGPGCDFDGAVLFRVPFMNLTHVSFVGCSFRGADLRFAAMESPDFTGVDLTGANLTGGSFANAIFEGAILRDVVADPAFFGSATFDHADLTGARMTRAIVFLQAWNGTICTDGQRADTTSPPTCEGRPGFEGPPMELWEFTSILVTGDPSKFED